MRQMDVFVWMFVVLLFAASSASAMGRSENSRRSEPVAIGTEADPAIRASDQNLKQLLFQPGSDAAIQGDAALAQEPATAPDRPRR